MTRTASRLIRLYAVSRWAPFAARLAAVAFCGARDRPGGSE